MRRVLSAVLLAWMDDADADAADDHDDGDGNGAGDDVVGSGADVM